jgi:hypothetical protein
MPKPSVPAIQTEDGFNTVIAKGLQIYHHHKNEDKLFDFLLDTGCDNGQADHLCSIIVNDYHKYFNQRKHAWQFIIVGILTTVGSLYLTIETFMTGTIIIVMYGAIASGIGMVVKGIMDLPKRNILKYP